MIGVKNKEQSGNKSSSTVQVKERKIIIIDTT